MSGRTTGRNGVYSRGYPDLVFITGDIANAGQRSEYAEFRRDFLAPLLDALGGDNWPGTVTTWVGSFI